MLARDGRYQEYWFDYDYFSDQVSVLSISRTITFAKSFQQRLYINIHTLLGLYIRLMTIKTLNRNYRRVQICCNFVFGHVVFLSSFPPFWRQHKIETGTVEIVHYSKFLTVIKCTKYEAKRLIQSVKIFIVLTSCNRPDQQTDIRSLYF